MEKINGFKIGKIKYGIHLLRKSEGNGRHIVGGYYSDGYDKLRPAKVCPYCGKEFKKLFREVKYEVVVKNEKHPSHKTKRIEFCTWTCKRKWMKENEEQLAEISIAQACRSNREY